MPGRGKGMKKHFVLTYLDGNLERLETYAEYQGESEDFPVRVSYWEDDYLVVPSWFADKEKAIEYIKRIEHETGIAQNYCKVKERHYPEGDPRIADAKIEATFRSAFPIAPLRGKIQEQTDGPMIEVWTMFIPEEAAQQYVAAFNEDVAETKGGEI
jgi:hypothetical protein